MSKSRFISGALILSVLIFFSCQDRQNHNSKINVDEAHLTQPTKRLTKGFILIDTKCALCHHWQEESESKVAPSLPEIKRAYFSAEPEQEQFIEAIQDYVNQPGIKKSKISSSFEKYGIMPVFNFPEDQVKMIAEYLFQTPVEERGWYDDQYISEKNKHAGQSLMDSLSHLAVGRDLALATKAVLGKNLMGAIKQNGTDQALEFCNAKAIHLTDSMALSLKSKIKRVSDQSRNPVNKANELEMAFIHQGKELLSKGEIINPVTFEEHNSIIGYYPIITNEMCLQCHGEKGKDIQSSTVELLKQLYPDDQATGYFANQLRGVWVIEMDKK